MTVVDGDGEGVGPLGDWGVVGSRSVAGRVGGGVGESVTGSMVTVPPLALGDTVKAGLSPSASLTTIMPVTAPVSALGASTVLVTAGAVFAGSIGALTTTVVSPP